MLTTCTCLLETQKFAYGNEITSNAKHHVYMPSTHQDGYYGSYLMSSCQNKAVNKKPFTQLLSSLFRVAHETRLHFLNVKTLPSWWIQEFLFVISGNNKISWRHLKRSNYTYMWNWVILLYLLLKWLAINKTSQTLWIPMISSYFTKYC